MFSTVTQTTATCCEYTRYKSDASTTLASTQKGYEANRDLLTSVSNWANGTPGTFSTYTYNNDALGRRNPSVELGHGVCRDGVQRVGLQRQERTRASRRYTGSYTPTPPETEVLAEKRLITVPMTRSATGLGLDRGHG